MSESVRSKFHRTPKIAPAVRIGSHSIDNNLVVAPMAGVTDRPFRQLCKRLGAGLAFSEMVASNPLLRGTEKSQRRMDHAGEVEPIVAQIAGAEPTQIADAARYNVERGAQIIDINMGCPAKKVCNIAAGSALLQNEGLVAAILDAVGRAVDVQAALENRTGWDCQIRHFLDRGERLPPPGAEEIRGVILGHLADHYAFYGEATGMRVARKHLGWYAKGLSGGEAFRDEVNRLDTPAAQIAAVNRFFDRLAARADRLEFTPATTTAAPWGEEALAA